MNIRTELGTLIRHVRKQRGWSQQRLAEMVGVSQVDISRFETGTNAPSVFTLHALACALEVEFSLSSRAVIVLYT